MREFGEELWLLVVLTMVVLGDLELKACQRTDALDL